MIRDGAVENRLAAACLTAIDQLRDEYGPAESDRTEQSAREQTIKRLQGRYEQLGGRFEKMYDDKFDGRISQELFEKKVAAIQEEQKGILQKILIVPKRRPRLETGRSIGCV